MSGQRWIPNKQNKTNKQASKHASQQTNKQAQRRAAAETAAFIRVVHYNDESSFNLEKDFEINPTSTKT